MSTYDYSQNERISLYAYNKFFEEASDPKSTLSTMPYSERVTGIQQYKIEKQSIAIPYYNDLNKLFQTTGFTYRSFFEMIGTPLHWLDERIAAVAEKLERLKECSPFLDEIHKRTQSMLPEIYLTDVWGWTPSYRMHIWRANVVNPDLRIKVRAEYKNQYARFFEGTDNRTRANTEDLMVLADLYGMPYHWLLCMPSEAVGLASIPLIEFIMDDFVMLPDTSKRIVEIMIDRALAALEGE